MLRDSAMQNASGNRHANVHELRELARQFRVKASETQLANYVGLMLRSADELERLAGQIEAGSDGNQAALLSA